MIRIIHLETSTKVCSVAISENGKPKDSITEKAESFAHSERLNILIHDLLSRNNLNFEDLNAVSVASGPGSYTGLRIGVSTAKGLCFALGLPLIAIDSLQSLAHVAIERKIVETHPSIYLCMIDARRMEAFTAIYDDQLYPIKPIAAEIFNSDYLTEVESHIPIYLIGDAQVKCNQIWEHRKNIVFTHLEADAIGQIRPAYEKFKLGQIEDLVYFEPFYLKDFQIGTKKS